MSDDEGSTKSDIGVPATCGAATDGFLDMWGKPAAGGDPRAQQQYADDQEEDDEGGMMEHHSSDMLGYLTEMSTAGYSTIRTAGGGGGGMGRRLGSYASGTGSPGDGDAEEDLPPQIAGSAQVLAIQEALDQEDFSDLLAEGERFAMEAAQEDYKAAESQKRGDDAICEALADAFCDDRDDKPKDSDDSPTETKAPMNITFSVAGGTTTIFAGGVAPTAGGGGAQPETKAYTAEEIEESRSFFAEELDILQAIFDPDQMEPSYATTAAGEQYLQSIRLQVLPQSTLETAFKVRKRKSDGLTLNVFWRQGYPEFSGPEITIEPWHNLLTRREVDVLYKLLAEEAASILGSPMLVTLCGAAVSHVEEAISRPEDLSFIHEDIGMKIQKVIGHGRDPSKSVHAPSQYIGNVAELLAKIPKGFDVVNVENVLKEDLAQRFDKMQRFFYKKHVEKYETDRKFKHLRGTKWVQELAEITPAFHGTRMDTIGRIVRNGLLVPGDHTGLKTRVGCRYGNGIYTSPDPQLSLWYAESGRDNAASIKLIITAVLLGKRFKVLDGHEPWGGGCENGHDSHVSEDGSQYCVFHEWQVLPCYVVHLMRRTYKERDSSLRGITGKQDAELVGHNRTRGSYLSKDDNGGGISKKERERIVTAMARKNLPFGFGPAGDKFVVEDIATYSDDEEDWGEYQAQLRGGGCDAPDVTEAYEEFQHETLLNPSLDPNRPVTVYEMNKKKNKNS